MDGGGDRSVVDGRADIQYQNKTAEKLKEKEKKKSKREWRGVD